MAEREGFEPPIALRLWLISSQLHSTGLCHLSSPNSDFILLVSRSDLSAKSALHRRALRRQTSATHKRHANRPPQQPTHKGEPTPVATSQPPQLSLCHSRALQESR